MASDFITIGHINGPHIDIVQPEGCGDVITLQDGIDILADPRTLWLSFQHIRNLMPAKQHEKIANLAGFNDSGFFGMIDGNPEEDESVSITMIFFHYPPEMTPLQALQQIENDENGILSPSLAITLLSVATFMPVENGQILQGQILGFVMLGGKIMATGISSLTDSNIESLLRIYLHQLVTRGAQIERYLPGSAVDRARFLLALAETCWKPEYRSAIAIAPLNPDTIQPLFSIAKPWLYLTVNAEVIVSNVKIPIARDTWYQIDPWLQVLEWETHQIPTKILKFLLPNKLHLPNEFSLGDTGDITDEYAEIMEELTQILLADIGTISQHLHAHYLSVDLPSPFTFLTSRRVKFVRLHGNTQDGFWVGLETSNGVAASFWWSPQPQMPVYWISGMAGKMNRLFFHLILVCILRDLSTASATNHSVPDDDDGYNLRPGLWSTSLSKYDLHSESGELESILNSPYYSAQKCARRLCDMAAKYGPQRIGQTCLTLLLSAIDYWEIPF